VSVPRWLPFAAVTLAVALFTWWNRGERVVVDVGFATFYRAPFTFVVFLAFLAGMLSMLLLSLRHDLRLRRELEARGLLDRPAAEPASPPPHAVAEPEPEDTLVLDTPPAAFPAADAEDAPPPPPAEVPAPGPHAADERRGQDGREPL
jgi:uncharacterized integral membrane protein